MAQVTLTAHCPIPYYLLIAESGSKSECTVLVLNASPYLVLIFVKAGHSQLYPLLQDSDVTVRASSVLALGELFGASSLAPTLADSQSTKQPTAQGSTAPQHKGPLTPGLVPKPPYNPFGVPAAALGIVLNWDFRSTPDSTPTLSQPVFGASNSAFVEQNLNLGNPSMQAVSPASSSSYAVFEGRKVPVLSAEQMELLEAELLLATQLLESCTDGSVLVRREAVIALSKFVILPHHVSCIRLVASGLFVEAKGGVKPSSEKRSVLSPSLSSSLSPTQLSLTQSLSQCQSIVDRVALFLHRVGYAAVGECGGGSSPIPCKSVSMARAYVRLWLTLNEVKGRDPHPVVGYAAAVLIRRITVHMGRDVDRAQLSATRHTIVGGSDNGAPNLYDSEEDELVEYEHEPALVSCLYNWSRYVLNSDRYPFPFLLSVSCPVNTVE
jgi:hypothetical protein